MGAVWARARAEMRARWGATVVLILLVGLVGGAVIAAAAGARRTDTAFPRMLESTRAPDALVSVGGSGSGPHGFYARVANLPEVAQAGQIVGVQIVSILPSGRPSFEFDAAATDRNIGTTIYHPNQMAGRFPDPSKPFEAFVNRVWADRYNVHVGSEMRLLAFAHPPSGPNGRNPLSQGTPFTFRVSGIGIMPDDVVPVTANDASPLLVLTPAFLHLYLERSFPRNFDGVEIRLRPGTDEHAFHERVTRLAAAHCTGRCVGRAGAAGLFYISDADKHTRVERAIHPQALALYLFACLAALGGLLALGQILSRQVFLDAVENPTLRSLGMTREQLVGVSLVRVGAIAVGGALLAAILAYLASGLFPIGPARLAEPHPGLTADWAFLGVGFLAAVLLLMGVTALAAWRTARARGTSLGTAEAPGGERPSRVGEWAARVGLAPSATGGIRMALESGRGRTAVPVRTALVGLAVATAATIAALTFGTNLNRLVSTPRLYGWNWDFAVDASFSTIPKGSPQKLLGRDPAVEAFAGGNYGDVTIAGLDVPAVGIDPLKGAVFPTIVQGRPIEGPDEIVLGTKVLRDIHRSLGDSISVAINGQTRTLRIVGRAIFPYFGRGAFSPTGLGEGAVVRAKLLSARNGVPLYNFVLIRYSQGTNADEENSRIRREVNRTAHGACLVNGNCIFRTARPPGEITSYARIRNTPVVLAAVLALLAVAMMAHTLVTSVRRRRRDLAVLKTLGFVKRQVFSTVAWQATTLVVIALVVGIPLGIAAGRWAWTVFADQLGVLADPVVPLTISLLIVPAAILLANVVAAAPGSSAARTHPAIALRTE